MSNTVDRGILSDLDRKSRRVQGTFGTLRIVVLVGLIGVGLGPLLWVAKASLSSSQDILQRPLSLFPSGGLQWANLSQAWFGEQIGLYIGNSIVIAIGCVVVNLVVCVLTAYVLSVLKPAWGKVLSGAILVTLFIPGVVILVPLYLTVLKLPLVGISLQNTYWAIWLVAGVNAFNILVVKRFFDQIPEDYFDAARIDGAGPLRVLVSIVIPMSRPILTVIALLTAIASWKEFLWPMLVLPNPAIQPVSVALTRIATTSSLSQQMASLFIALILPVVFFIVFQRQFLRGVSSAGGVKG